MIHPDGHGLAKRLSGAISSGNPLGDALASFISFEKECGSSGLSAAGGCSPLYYTISWCYS